MRGARWRGCWGWRSTIFVSGTAPSRRPLGAPDTGARYLSRLPPEVRQQFGFISAAIVSAEWRRICDLNGQRDHITGLSMSDIVSVKTRYDEWFRVTHLSMPPTLAGAEHQFTFEDASVKIKLPETPAEGEVPSEYSKAYVSRRRATTNEIIEVEIYAVLVSIDALNIDLPVAAAEYPAVNSTLYNADQARELDGRSNQLWYLARRILDYWLRVVRWRTGYALIDLATSLHDATLLGGRLINCTTGNAFYSPRIGRTVVVPPTRRLTFDEWAAIGGDLVKNAFPPVWHEYLMSGRRRIEVGDLTAAVIDLAVAIEVAVRLQVDSKLPPATPRGICEVVARMNMTEVFRRWEDLDLPAKNSIPSFADITNLVEVRNAIMHRGSDPRITRDFCLRASAGVEKAVQTLNGS
jgi:hypothetical protein